jgi:transposase
MGRPTVLTPDVQAAIVDALRKGNYRSTAAAAAGIHRNSLTNWEKWGEEGREPYADFVTAMQQAEAQAEMDLVSEIRNAEPGIPTVKSPDLWQAKAWILERRYGGKWCARVKQQVAENVEALTSKLKAKPELHQQVVDVLSADEEPATAGASTPRH